MTREQPLVIKADIGPTLSSNQQQLKDFANLSSDCFWEVDAALQYTYVSDRFTEITGIPQTIVLGMSNDDLGLTHGDQRTEQEFRTLLNDRNSFRNVVFSYVHPDGRDIDILVNGDAIHDGSGSFLGYRGTARQVDGRSNAADVKQETKAMYQLAGRIDNLGFWEWDEVANKCTFCSEELAKIHGVTVDDFVQRSLLSKKTARWMHPDDLSRYEAAEEAFRKNHIGFAIEYRVVRADDSVAHIYEAVAPILDRDGTLIRSFGFTKDVTERRRADVEMEKIASKHRQTESLAMIGHWEWDDIADQCIFCSEEMAHLHGLSVEDYLATSNTFEGDLAFVHPDDRSRYDQFDDEYMSRPARTEIEYRLLAGGDKIRDVREVLEPVFDAENRHVRTVGFIQDITATKKAAASLEQAHDQMEERVKQRTAELQIINGELLESQSRLRDATRIAKLGYFTWDITNHRGMYFDDEYAKILGISVAECMAESLDDYLAHVHENDVEVVTANYRDGAVYKAPIDVEYRIIQPNGDLRYVHERSALELDRAGSIIARFGTVQDITERKVATLELAEVEEQLHELSANAREVFYVLTADWEQVLYVNGAYEDIWGYSRKAVIDNPRLWLESLHPDDRDMIVAEIREKLSGNDSSPNFSDCRIIGANGEVRWLANRMYPIHDDDGTIVRYAGVAEDISERKAATDTLHQVQKMDAVGQLTGGVAHDFNNLLAVILGNSGLLQGCLAEDDELLLQDIIVAGNRGAELTKRLLAFSRLQPLQSTQTDVVQLAFGMEGLLQRTLGTTISVEITSSCRDAVAFVDSGLLENAILNLSLNARDAMPDGGRLTIRVNDSLWGSEDTGLDNALEIVVQDDGVGMNAEVLSHSLEPFFTTKDSSKGSGLGLPMVYGFVKQSNGDLVIDSRPGEGTVVTIILPRVEDEKASR